MRIWMTAVIGRLDTPHLQRALRERFTGRYADCDRQPRVGSALPAHSMSNE